jgi:hypothetical protein
VIKTKAEAEAHQKHHGFLKGPVNAPECPVAAFKPKRGAKEPNKTEQAFKDWVGGTPSLQFEPVKLRIGPNCYYTPDWGLMTGKPVFYEVKGGHIWDDSMVKFKAAKERHQWADFEMWQKKKGEWTRLL